MSKSRKLLISALLVLGIGFSVWLIWERAVETPLAARLLPEGDAIFYANLEPIHLLDLGKSRPLELESDYKDFVKRTGIQFERDLDEVAMSRRDTADGHDVESAEIFAGKFDAAKLGSYLQQHSAQTENYRGLIVYAIPHEGHMVRVCLLDHARVAVTNMSSADPIRGMIDRFQHRAGEPTLIKEYYRRVPAVSMAWLIDRMPANTDAPQLPGGLNFGFLQNTVAVVSLRFNGSFLLRGDVVTFGDDEAGRVVNSANTFLAVYRSVGSSMGASGNDPDIKAALESIHVEQDGKTAVFTATFSQRFVKKIVAEAGPEVLSATPTPAPGPSPK